MADIIPEIATRRARRAYSNNGIDRSTLERLFSAATLAPSCNNKQPWRFLICTDGDALDKAREALAGGNYWAKEAAALVVVTTRDAFDCQLPDGRNYAQFDTGMAVMGLLLQATREGLYAHPMAGFDPAVLRTQFDIEDETQIITMIAVGHPGSGTNLNEKHTESERSERQRKGLDEIVQWNEWRPLA